MAFLKVQVVRKNSKGVDVEALHGLQSARAHTLTDEQYPTMREEKHKINISNHKSLNEFLCYLQKKGRTNTIHKSPVEKSIRNSQVSCALLFDELEKRAQENGITI